MNESIPPGELLRRLDAAASGLLVPSESDHPLTPFSWPAGDPTPDAVAAAVSPGAPVEQIPPDALFSPLIAPGDAEAARFQTLLDLLRAHLDDLRVYRVGRVDIDCLVLGRHASGAWLGLRTRVVET